jgi:tetratricopeptide (TPR) repeat protein
MKKHGMVLVVGIILLALSGMVAGCGKKEAGGDKLQAAIEAVAGEKTPENYLTLSLRYYEVMQFDKCIEAAQESIKLKSDFAPAYNNICAAYNSQNMWDKGIEACQQALKIDPGFQLARNNLNWALSAKTSPK